MAHKLPTISTKGGSRPKFVIDGKSGYLVEVDNPQQLAQKAIEMLESPQNVSLLGNMVIRWFGTHIHGKKQAKKLEKVSKDLSKLRSIDIKFTMIFVLGLTIGSLYDG
jgi:glycosyltransferase involved in cell wall biosynthesis